jgi:hypothetical protein
MFFPLAQAPVLPRQPARSRRPAAATVLILAAATLGCGGATRGASSPQQGKTTTTAAQVGRRIERLVVADRGTMAMVSREGCVASLHTMGGDAGSADELRVRCPKPERLKTWFEGADRVMASFSYEPSKDDDDDDEQEVKLPAAKVLTAAGKTLKVSREADVTRLLREVQSLSAELASAEEPSPGPASPGGWQMLHVIGPAHVLFAGKPSRGMFEARMSTTGQYMCEFITNAGDGPMRATKSGWLAAPTAARAIDEVLKPFAAVGPNERVKGTYAAGTRAGDEKRSNDVSTGAVFERFAHVQDALGDACLPELEPPSAASIGL